MDTKDNLRSHLAERKDALLSRQEQQQEEQQKKRRHPDKDFIKEHLVSAPLEEFIKDEQRKELEEYQLDPKSIMRKLSCIRGEHRQDREQELDAQADEVRVRIEKQILKLYKKATEEHIKEREKRIKARLSSGEFPYDWMKQGEGAELMKRRPLVVPILNFLDRQNRSLTLEQCEQLWALVPDKKHIVEKTHKDGTLYEEERNYAIIVMDNKLLAEIAETFECPPAYVKEHIQEFHRVRILKKLGKLDIGKKGGGSVLYADGYYNPYTGKDGRNKRGKKIHFLTRKNIGAWLSLFPLKTSSVHEQSEKSKKRRKSKKIEGSKS